MPARLHPRPRGSALHEAPRLLGRVLARALADGTVVRGRIVEVEAYEPDDPASHAFRGPTRRNRRMFDEAGHLYVYRSYGVHWCANVVTGPPGIGSAVLLRALEPLDPLEPIRARRPGVAERDLCRGPGRLTLAFGIDGRDDGVDLFDETSAVWLEPGRGVRGDQIVAGPRVGISVARDLPWRFSVARSRWVSAPAATTVRISAAASRP